MLGHTLCGAVSASTRPNGGYVKFITDEIRRATGDETEPVKASILNVKQSVEKIRRLIKPAACLQITGALYRTDSGVVDFEPIFPE